MPSITYWTRLEPRSRRDDATPNLAAPVRDAAWMLSRQWQTGEFKGEDAATAVSAKISGVADRLAWYKPLSGAVRPLDPARPLETDVERETPAWGLRMRVQAGQWLSRELARAGADAAPFAGRYRLEPPASPDDLPPGVLRYWLAAAGRAIDGRKAAEDIVVRSGTQPPEAGRITVYSDSERVEFPEGLEPADRDAAGRAVRAFEAWLRRTYGGAHPGDSCWKPSQLEYGFSVAAPGPDGRKVLQADEYAGGHLDWYSFSLGDPATLEPAGPAPSEPAALEQSFVPANMHFRGFPNRRWWQFEDGQTDFGELRVGKPDLGKLLLMEFAMQASNDWFVVPFKLPLGSLCRITKLVVTDVFGEKTLIEPAGKGAEQDWQRWSMFTLSRAGALAPEGADASTLFFLPPSLGWSVESPAIEDVRLLRDEMGNMVWGVEKTYEDELGDPVDGYEEFQRRRAMAPEAAHDGPLPRYRLSSSVPDNWIPFVPAHTGSQRRAVALERAALISVDGAAPARPRGLILEPGVSPYRVNEEEVPRGGTVVTRAWQLARWVDGSLHLWVGRRKTAGGGEGSSGLRFDAVLEKKV